MKNFSMKRVGNLLRYDLRMEQHRIGNAILIILAVIAALAIMQALSGTDPGSIGTKMNSELSIGLFAMVFVLTKVVQTKFTDPRTSVSYLTLPGSPLEKYVTLLADYALGFLALAVLYVPVFYLVMLLGKCINSDASWLVNIFHPQTVQDTLSQVYSSVSIQGQDMSYTNSMVDDLMQSEWVYKVTGWFTELLLLLVYVMLNMHFRTNSQLKSVGVIALAMCIFSMAGCVFGTCLLLNARDFDAEQLTTTMQNSAYTMMVILPLLDIALLYGLYRQVLTRQAK